MQTAKAYTDTYFDKVSNLVQCERKALPAYGTESILKGKKIKIKKGGRNIK